MTSPVHAVLQGLYAGISGFRLPVVSNDPLENNYQQYWESWFDPGCQLSVPAGRANLSNGTSGSSSVSIKPSSDTSIFLLFQKQLRKLHSTPSCALSQGHSGVLSSRRHQRCLYGQAQELKLWSRVYSSISTRLRSLRSRERAHGAGGPGKRQCCNHRAREMNINATKAHYFALIDSNFIILQYNDMMTL